MPRDLKYIKQARRILNSINPEEKLRLRDDVLPHAKKREWIFKGIEKADTILLAPELEEYIWEANFGDIDWEEYRRRNQCNFPFPNSFPA